MAMSSKRLTEKNNWVHNFEVSHPVRHKKGFTVYKVVSTVFPKPFPEGATKLTVWKRFNDFKKLYNELGLIHKQLYLAGEFPKFPKSKVFGRFNDDVIEERQKSALSLLIFSATHPQLYTSKVFVKFFESGYQIEDLCDDAINLTKDDSLDKLNDDCLIPERVWEKTNKTSKNADQLPVLDHVSGNSAISSSPDTPTLSDSDSLISGSLLSISSDTFVNSALPSSSSDYVLTSKFDSSSSLGKKFDQTSNNGGLTFSPSLTEDLNTSVQNASREIDSQNSPCSLSMVSNSVSCSSLTALPFSKAKTDGTSTTSLSRQKKSNGFGFFDFLPIFPKKLQKKKHSEEKLFADSLTASYICEAAGHFAVAQHHESNSDYADAFTAYKEGIGVLLSGAQSDTDQKRRTLVRSKLDKYLMRAEALHAEHLASDVSSSEMEDYIFLPSKDSLVELESSSCPITSSSLESSNIIELKKYKVVGCLPNRVLIVVNMMDDKPKCFAVKVVTKSSCPVEPEKPTIIPTNVPFMVNLIQWFETENSVVLLMPYIGGGKLIDFVKTYQTKQIAVISHDCSPTDNECAFEPSFPTSTNTLTQGSHDALKVLAALSQIGNDSYDLKLPNQGNPENYESCIPLLEELSIETTKMSSIERGLKIGRKNKEVISPKCFNGEDVVLDESERKEMARRSNLENETEGRVGSENETKECNACPSSPNVCETKTDRDCGDNDKNVKAFRHRLYEPADLKLPTNSDTFTLSTPKAANFSQFAYPAVSKCDYDDESLDVVDASATSFRQPKSIAPEDLVDETQVLIESSKDLIQTVSNTLANGRVARQKMTTPEYSNRSHVPEGGGECNGNTLTQERGNESSLPFIQDSIHSFPYNMHDNESYVSAKKNYFDSSDDAKCKLNESVHDEKQCLSDEGFSGKEEDKKLKMRFKRQSKSEELPVDTQENDTDGLAALALKRMVPECCVKVWAAEMILALEKLHAMGLTYGDLDMRNVLLGENGHILLSFTCLLSEVDQVPLWSEYLAPEARISVKKSVWNLHSSADWWSLGAILFLLLTGEAVEKYHPEGFHAQTVLKIPDKNVCEDYISASAKTLLTELLNFSPELRLGYYGAEEIKSHPFFESFDWDAALDSFNAERTG